MAEWLKAHAWKACGHQKCLVGSNPTPSADAAHGGEQRPLAHGRAVSEGWQNGNAPVSKTGALTGLRVRIPSPPLAISTSYGRSELRVSEGPLSWWDRFGSEGKPKPSSRASRRGCSRRVWPDPASFHTISPASATTLDSQEDADALMAGANGRHRTLMRDPQLVAHPGTGGLAIRRAGRWQVGR